MVSVDLPPGLPDTAGETRHRFTVMRPTGGDEPRVGNDGLPPGPRWPAILQTVALLRYRHRFHPWLARRYGDRFTVRLVPGGQPLVLFTRPEDVREVFAADPAVFHAGRANGILGPIMGQHSLLLQDGAEHQRARTLLMPAFHGQALRGYRALVRDIARAEVDDWSDGDELVTLDRMNAVTLEVILRVVFGVTDERRLAALRPRVNATVDVSPAVLLGWSYPVLQRFGLWRRTVETQHELDRLLFAEVRERRHAADLDQRADVLSRLVRASREAEREGRTEDVLGDTELRDQLITLLLAGHETTASALAWALWELGRDGDLLARSTAAARAGTEDDRDAEADTWLEAVVKESMRLHPIIPIVNRTLVEPATINGLDLAAGVTVGPSIVVSHARSEAFEDPAAFRPDRFVGTNPAANTWIPFGGGVRRCIGAGFSLMEGVEVLRAVLAAYDVEAVGPDRPRVRNITSVPRDGARVRLSRR